MLHFRSLAWSVIARFIFGFSCAIFLAACDTTSPPPPVAEGPAIISAVSRVAKKTAAPTVSVSAAPSQINSAETATFVVSTSRVNRRRATTVRYAMSGTAVAGVDYSLGGASGQVVIPAGANSGGVTLTAQTSGSGAGRTATMSLEASAGYRLSNARAASVLIDSNAQPTPTSTPAPTPRPTPAQSVWIAARTDGLPGSGTQDDPYDGSTQPKFDGVMSNLQGLTNLGINIGDGVFRTSATKSWVVRPGWVIAGAGMYQTAIQLAGSVTGIHGGVGCLASNPNFSTDNVVIRDLTCDANWDELGPTADSGAGARAVTDATIVAGVPTVTSTTANFGPADYSRTIVGGGIPAGAIIASVQDAQHATMSKNATTNASGVSLTIGGEKNVKTGALAITGSNNLVENVRSINTYGSAANLQEQFVILLGGPRGADGYNNVIQSCRVELPRGNYGNPYAIAGTPPHLTVNSKVLSCYAEGRNDGLMTGFTSGGVNIADVKDCQVDGCTFVDCLGAVYQDTGVCDGFQVTNNTVIRGAMGVSFVTAGTGAKRNIVVSGNNIQIQNRISNGAGYGVFISHTGATNVTVTNNTITFDNSGRGQLSYWGISASPLTAATISDNVFGFVQNAYFNNGVAGSGITLSNNRMSDGSPAIGLSP